jgi:hybrid cluster-associated redox disulfide protein
MHTPENATMNLTDLSLDQIMSRWPPTIRLFLDRRMHCVGCPIAPFHTVIDAAEEHGLSYDVLLSELEARVGRDEGRPPP